ncbi:MAG: DUF2905 domain-containing protein [Nitrospira sp. SB0677_bin_15]|nr:DUF2905 domain-containing protein [Nitrospira sp. SB0667_bin_9]MYD30530.1 DUF2905 domain-containing protein [Nitrospira sp. SB0661_bin_20]MYG41476.1 DUF2905 domain-containing protein [Nitrospira sp. SB0677_bin_15]MYH01134.1 DUF2905 domain-containing protein [Nitrospira sp. SB0675_bin_23]MYJ22804.1 DUF2905 domain-containing protein [Nitrospira sp. SB0673_bin_12]
MPEFIGKMLIMLGLGIVVLGIVVSLLGKWPGEGTGLGWPGKLPGDIFIKRDNFTFYFPLGTSIVISLVGSLLLYFFLKR